MTLNSSDFYRMKNPVGESEAETTSEPSELEKLRLQAEHLAKKLSEVEQREQSTSDKFRKYMEDSNKRTDILRQEIERRASVAPTAQPQPTNTPSQTTQDEGGNTWMELLGLQQSQSEDRQVADNQQSPKYFTEEDIDRRIEEKQRKAMEEAQRAQQALQERITELRQDFVENHKDIAGDPKLQNFFAQTVNDIQSLNPSISVDEAYKLAINKTRQAASIFSGGEGKKKPAAPTQSPYLVPSQQQNNFRQQMQSKDPVGAYADNSSEEQVREQRAKEIAQLRQNHLSKFIR